MASTEAALGKGFQPSLDPAVVLLLLSVMLLLDDLLLFDTSSDMLPDFYRSGTVKERNHERKHEMTDSSLACLDISPEGEHYCRS